MMAWHGVEVAAAESPRPGLLGNTAIDAPTLQVMTAYIAVAIAVLIGAGLRLRTPLQRYPVVRGLLVLVLVIVASTLVAFMRLPVLQPFVELSTPPWWLWLLALVWMVLGAALEWGRQQIDKLPK